MQIRRSLPDTARKIALFVQSLRLWTLELVALWVEMFGGRDGRIALRRKLRQLRRDTRLVFFIAAVSRLTMRAGGGGTRRPRSAPPGAQYRRPRTRFIRLVTRRIRLRTLADIRAALARFEAHTTRAFAGIPKRFLFGALVMRNVDLFPRAALCAACANADAHDTS